MNRRVLLVFTGVLLSRGAAATRTFTVSNNCSFTIWPAIFTDLNAGSDVPDQPTGWEAPPFSQVTFSVPDNWNGGRIWGRRDCDFNTGALGRDSCLTGGCDGGLLCDSHTGTGASPVTIAEFWLSDLKDYFDVSLVEGFNLPMRIVTDQGCAATCRVDLIPNCPSVLQGPFDSSGNPAGCKSACVANLDGDPENSPNCCTGSHNTPATCPPSRVDFYSYFKMNCPDTYVYLYDNLGGGPILQCGFPLADYTVIFCPQWPSAFLYS